MYVYTIGTKLCKATIKQMQVLLKSNRLYIGSMHKPPRYTYALLSLPSIQSGCLLNPPPAPMAKASSPVADIAYVAPLSFSLRYSFLSCLSDNVFFRCQYAASLLKTRCQTKLGHAINNIYSSGKLQKVSISVNATHMVQQGKWPESSSVQMLESQLEPHSLHFSLLESH